MTKPRCSECNHWLSRAETEGVHFHERRCHRCLAQAVERMVAEATPTDVRYFQALLGEWVEGLIDARISELTII